MSKTNSPSTAADVAVPKRGPGRPRKNAEQAPKSARRLADINGVRSYLGDVSAGLVTSLVRAGDLPAPYRLGQLRRWDLDEIDAALEKTRIPKGA